MFIFQFTGYSTKRDLMSHWSRLTIPLLVACITVAFISGCSKEKLKEALEEAKTQTKSLTESTVQAIEDKLPESGSLSLEITPASPAINQMDLALIEIGDGRPNVVQIVSYDVRRPARNFPSVMLHGTTAASTASSLVGTTIACDVYYQASPDAPIAMTKPGGSVSVTFDAFDQDEKVINAKLGAVDLLSSDDQTISIRGGQLVAVVRGAGN